MCIISGGFAENPPIAHSWAPLLKLAVPIVASLASAYAAERAAHRWHWPCRVRAAYAAIAYFAVFVATWVPALLLAGGAAPGNGFAVAAQFMVFGPATSIAGLGIGCYAAGADEIDFAKTKDPASSNEEAGSML